MNAENTIQKFIQLIGHDEVQACAALDVSASDAQKDYKT